MFDKDDNLNHFDSNEDYNWLKESQYEIEQQILSNNHNVENRIKPVQFNRSEEVIDLENDDNNIYIENINHSYPYQKRKKIFPIKRHDYQTLNKNDDEECFEIPFSEVTKKIEMKYQNPCKIKMLTEEETQKFAMENSRRKNEIAMIRDAKKKKYKTIPSNVRFNQNKGELEQISTPFDEAIEKEFNDNQYFIPSAQYKTKEQFEKENKRDNERQLQQQIQSLKEDAKYLGINLNFFSVGGESISERSTSVISYQNSFENFLNKKRSIKSNNNDLSLSNHENKIQKQHEPKRIYPIIDIKQKKYNIVRKIYNKDKHCRKDLMILFKQAKNYMITEDKQHFQYKEHELLQKKNEEQMKQFYSIGIFLYKNLCYDILTNVTKNQSHIIQITNNILWRASDVQTILESIQNDKQYENKLLDKLKKK